VIEHGEVFVKLAKIEDGVRMDLGGTEYFLHTAKCATVECGDACDCNGFLVLDEIVATLESKENAR
jgi:hypothetical protein